MAIELADKLRLICNLKNDGADWPDDRAEGCTSRPVCGGERKGTVVLVILNRVIYKH